MIIVIIFVRNNLNTANIYNNNTDGKFKILDSISTIALEILSNNMVDN